jgi:hypothetical protein
MSTPVDFTKRQWVAGSAAPFREVNAMMTKLAQSFAMLSVVASIGLVSTAALAEKIKESGSIDAAYVKKDAQPIPDQEGHMLSLTDAQGVNKNTGGTGYLDGFSANVRDFADLTQGNGPHQGYVIYAKESDQQVVKIDGMVTTTMKDGRPNTTFKGKWVIVDGKGALAGTKGEGTYSGYFTAEDKYHVDWEGTRSDTKAASADAKK